ncbi:S-layer homology domain-containing protein [Bacillus benzoevorans]|uniref:SLH domain-containing protein n=1 Tax=Bacillus benzoevorans TaxID=1456 RepID=A0A7X0HSK2_9BACI|nr:S-layer homology domain-containing protein [Bacillus benzoevorans]MBB6446092.1 hypothetical protein [Bacillus benzoevorans]
MKKYPFSKKAITAILAATVAFSPVVSIGGVFEPSTVEAATANDALTRMQTIYSQFSTPEKVIFNKAAIALKDETKFTTDDWRDVLTAEVANNFNAKLVATANNADTTTNYSTVSAESIAAAIATLSYDASSSNLATMLSDFKTSPQGEALEYIVGPGTTDLVLQFLADSEKKLWDKGFASIYTTLKNGGTIETITKQVRDELISENPTYATLNSTLYSELGTNLDGIIEMKNRINEKLVSKTIITESELSTLRDAFILAAFLAGNPNGGGGGGGGVVPPAPTENPALGEVTLPQDATETVKQGSTVVTQVPAAKVAEIVTQITAEKAVIPLTLGAPAAGETAKAELPATLFTQAAEKNANAAVNVKTEEASYQLPVSEINVASLANELGVAASDVKIEISVNVVPQAEVKADLDNNKLNAVSDVIEFTVKAVSGDKEVSVSKFSTYVKRTITGTKTFNPARTAVVKLVNGKFQGAPATFNGKEATIYKKDNSKYVIVENDKTFTDVDNGKNFAEASIEKLASKYIIFGKSDTEYANSLAITRGEFAALISRALGLTAQNPTQLKFTDTPNTKAVNQNGEINAVAEAGIVSGYAGNIFKPDQPINRAEAAIMLSKALDYVKVASSEYTTSKKLADFKDDAVIGTTSRQYVEKVYQAGLMSGFSDKSFGPDKSMQRDQMAVVLDKLLQAAKLID